MYNFYKMTNPSKIIQFQHPDFHRNRSDRLYLIKRKNPSDAKKIKVEPDIEKETRDLEAKIEKITMIIKAIEAQNKILMEINKEEIAQFLVLRKDGELTSFRLLFLLHSLIANYQLEFVDFMKEVAFKIDWLHDGDDTLHAKTPQNIFENLTRVIRDFTSSKPEVERLLQRLVTVFMESAKLKEGGSLCELHRSRQISAVVNDFMDRLKTNNNSVFAKYWPWNTQPLAFYPKSDGFFTLEQQHFDDNDSMALDLKSENFQDINLSANQPVYPSSNNDSVCESHQRSYSDFLSSLKATFRHRYK